MKTSVLVTQTFNVRREALLAIDAETYEQAKEAFHQRVVTAPAYDAPVWVTVSSLVSEEVSPATRRALARLHTALREQHQSRRRAHAALGLACFLAPLDKLQSVLGELRELATRHDDTDLQAWLRGLIEAEVGE